MGTIIQTLLGAVICLLFVLVARQTGLKREPTIYAVGLVFAASIYVCFAALGSASLSWLALESVGEVLFSAVTLLGLRSSLWFLVLGWATHPIWDVLLHKVLSVGFVPEGTQVGVSALTCFWRFISQCA